MSRPTKKQAKQLHRVCSARQFRKIYQEGTRFSSSFFTAFTLPNELGNARLGITVTRKIGNAVVRNRCKRRLRAIFQDWRKQQVQPEPPLGLDLVINVKTELHKAEYAALLQAFARTLERADTFWRKRQADQQAVTAKNIPTEQSAQELADDLVGTLAKDSARESV